MIRMYQRNFLTLLTFVSFLSVSLVACQLRDRLNREELIDYTKQIMQGEEIFRNSNHTYCSLEKLIKEGLVDSKLADGKELDYDFELIFTAERYTLRVKPEENTQSISDVMSLFLDESKVIRVSVDPKALANANSSPLYQK